MALNFGTIWNDITGGSTTNTATNTTTTAAPNMTWLYVAIGAVILGFLFFSDKIFESKPSKEKN
ncbi:MAG TPA: hypothetical protein VNG53_01080 [Bacteroidia bacterium]|nr:hypothetical protein [Bacteroidia bacterium]